MSTEQRQRLDAFLRQGTFPAVADVNEQRRQLKALLSAQPLPADVTGTAATLGGVPIAEITVDGNRTSPYCPVHPRRCVRAGRRRPLR